MIAFVLIRVFLILLLVAANAFFAAAEFALVSIRETRIQQLIEARRIGARIVQITRTIRYQARPYHCDAANIGWGDDCISRHRN